MPPARRSWSLRQRAPSFSEDLAEQRRLTLECDQPFSWGSIRRQEFDEPVRSGGKPQRHLQSATDLESQSVLRTSRRTLSSSAPRQGHRGDLLLYFTGLVFLTSR